MRMAVPAHAPTDDAGRNAQARAVATAAVHDAAGIHTNKQMMEALASEPTPPTAGLTGKDTE